MTMTEARDRSDLKQVFARRAAQGGRPDPRRFRRVSESGEAEQVADGVRVRSRVAPRARRDTMFVSEAGRLRYDPMRNDLMLSNQDKRADRPSQQSRTIVISSPDFEVFSVLEPGDSDLSKADLGCLSAARFLSDGQDEAESGAVIAISLGSKNQLSASGADRSIKVGQPNETAYLPEAFARKLFTLVETRQPRHIVFPDSPVMRDTAARLACLVGVKPAFRVHGFDGSECVRRGFGGLKDLHQPFPRILTVQSDAVPQSFNQDREARALDFEEAEEVRATNIEHLHTEQVDASELALEEAPFIFAVGAGVTRVELFTRVSERLNAATACSRVISDSGSMPRHAQVGASGRQVAADCYVAFGISGAVQHLQGIDACEHVVAVNIDPAAPIVRRADLSIICDANEMLNALQGLLEEQRK